MVDRIILSFFGKIQLKFYSLLSFRTINVSENVNKVYVREYAVPRIIY